MTADCEACRARLEAALGRTLPFDDQVLAYLLKVAPVGDSQELEELAGDFCPQWPRNAQSALAVQLKVVVGSSAPASGGAGKRDLDPGGAGDDFDAALLDLSLPKAEPRQDRRTAQEMRGAKAPADGRGGGRPESTAPAGDLEADLMLARMLQEEEEAEVALASGQHARSAKGRQKKGFRPLNINYTVGRGATPAALGTAAPSSLADLLRSRRAQANPGSIPPESFGPPAARQGSSWAPSPQDLGGPAAARPPGEEPLDAWELRAGGLREGFAEVARRSANATPAANSKTPAPGVAARGAAPTPTVTAAVRPPPVTPAWAAAKTSTRSGPEVTRGGPEAPLKIRLRLPSGDTASIEGVPAAATTAALKQRIQKDHGMRVDHQALSFYGLALQDSQRLMDVGIADGGLIDVALRPPGLSTFDPPLAAAAKATPKSKALKQAQMETFAGLQTSEHGRILTEEEALRLALEASRDKEDSEAEGEALDEDIAGGGDVGLCEVDESEFHVDIGLQDERMQPLIAHARRIASMLYNEDCIGKVSKRSGYRLTLLAGKGKKVKTVLGYTVYRFRKNHLSVLQVGIAGEQRGNGLGRRLVAWIVQHARRVNIETVALASPPGSVRFYRGLGFAVSDTPALDADDLAEGQVCMEYKCRKAGRGAAGGSGKTGGDAKPKVESKPSAPTAGQTSISRKVLIKKVFALCDVDGNGVLSQEEMHTFAIQTGFDGSDEDWVSEYAALCSDNGRSPAVGIDEAVLIKLVDDESDQGCYCTEQELIDMVTKLEALVSKPSASTTSTVPPPSERQQLSHAIFELLDVDGDSYLNAQEMFPFAAHTGFEGTAEDWSEEYAALSSEAGASQLGIDSLVLTRLIDDESDAGCYCTVEELREMLEKLRAESPRRTSAGVDGGGNMSQPAPEPPPTPAAPEPPPTPAAPEPPPASAPAVQTPLASSAPVPQSLSANTSRAELVTALFRACDADGDGRLSIREMRVFATQTGFEGSDEEWATEFQALCDEGLRSSEDGVDHELFARLVDDPSESGCYCTDSELRDMLGILAHGHDSREHAVATTSHIVGQTLDANVDDDSYENIHSAAAAPPSWPPPDEASGSHAGPADADFHAGDAAEDEELRDLVAAGPASRSDERLQRSRPQSAAPAPSMGVSSAEAFIGTAVSSSAAPTAPAAATASVGAAPHGVVGRADLIRAVFRACDLDNDGVLNVQEMRAFAKHIGFEGSDEEWAEEFEMLCSENGRTTAEGIDVKLLTQLADDPSDNGCYCTDGELRDLLRKLFTNVRARIVAADKSASAPTQRRELMRTAFAALDVDADGVLNEAEMLTFARSTGFDGSQASWQEEYAILFNVPAAEGRSPSEGVTMSLFAALVDDDSEEGCYCSDEELSAMVEELGSNVRSGLIASLFEQLADNAGTIGRYAFRQFASLAGLMQDSDGGAEWTAQAQIHNIGAMDRELFASYCDGAKSLRALADVTLRTVLVQLRSAATGPREASASSTGAHAAPPKAGWKPPPGLDLPSDQEAAEAEPQPSEQQPPPKARRPPKDGGDVPRPSHGDQRSTGQTSSGSTWAPTLRSNATGSQADETEAWNGGGQHNSKKHTNGAGAGSKRQSREKSAAWDDAAWGDGSWDSGWKAKGEESWWGSSYDGGSWYSGAASGRGGESAWTGKSWQGSHR